VTDRSAFIVAIPDDDPKGTTTVRVTAPVGRTLEIRLAGGAVAGYAWVLTEWMGDAVEILGDPRSGQSHMPVLVPGYGGTFFFFFEAVRPGRAYVAFTYSRPGDIVYPVIRTAAVWFDIQDVPPTCEEVVRANPDTLGLALTHYGEEAKPFYSLRLYAGGADRPSQDFRLAARLSKDEASRLVDFLAKEGILDDARAAPPRTGGESGYLLTISVTGATYYADLGWGPAMLARLDRLRAALSGESAKGMDQLLDRLSGYRTQWASPPRGGK
jgi:predicted secreted protein